MRATITLDHFIVPVHDKAAAAQQLASLLGVAWGPATVGSFAQVAINDGCTLDFKDAEGALPKHHYCFRVDEAAFDAILDRLRKAEIPFRSTVHGPVDGQINLSLGGSNVYWSEPGGHHWEMLTVSYARLAQPARTRTRRSPT